MRFLVDANVPLSVAPPAREDFRSTSAAGLPSIKHQTSNIEHQTSPRLRP